MRTLFAWIVLAACAGLGACDARVTVDATANAGAQYSSVLITVREVWVNESATATPEDENWHKFPLSPVRTLELVDSGDAAMNELASELEVAPGTYHQMRLFLVDRGEPLTETARAAGAVFNDQVTFFAANGVESTLALELPDAARGIGIETELVVPVARDAVIAALVATSDTSNASSTLPGTTTGPVVGEPELTVAGVAVSGTVTPGVPLGSVPPDSSTPNPALPGTTPAVVVSPPASTPGTSSGAGTGIEGRKVTITSGVFFDAARDLVAFRFGDRPGFLLNPSLVAYDVDKVGTIQAQLDLSSVAPNADTGRPDVEVTAERLDDDLGRRVEIASAAVRADGSFTLYPLPRDPGADGPATYDLVIHGPAVTTVVIRAVPVTDGTPDSGSDVALGTITLTVSSSYAANLAGDSAVAPRGARVQFYQTLADDDAPFLIDERPVDPLTGRFATDEPLSAAPVVVYGTFDAAFSLVAAAPVEGAARYAVTAFAPLYGHGGFAGAPIGPPAVAGSAAAFTVPEIPIPATAAAGTITANVIASTPGKYDNGALLVTHDGAIVTAAPLAAALRGAQPSTAVSVPGVPASASSGFERGFYYLEAWAWNSANPQDSFTRQPVASAVDLRDAPTVSAEVTLN